MTVVSMTGFAEAHGAHEAARWRWEVKSVNGRGMELRLRMPPGFDGIEIAARTLAAERFKRGNIQATLTMELREETRGLKIDPAALNAAVRLAKQIADETGLAPARVDGILSLKGVIVQDEAAVLAPEERAARDAEMLKSVAMAFDSLRRARRTEGAKLAAVLKSQIDEIETLTQEANRLSATQPAALRDKLAAQVKELMNGTQLSEERLTQEVALLATRADIREELDRLDAHVHEARALLSSGEAVGRKLDFLAQEFNR
jgi:uncharacterized protein (TIGR00255 family)